MKIMNKKRLRRKTIGPGMASSNEYDNVKQEMAIMKKLDHPYVLKLYEIIDDPENQKLYLIIELVRNGSLVKRVIPAPKDKMTKKRSKNKNKTP